MLKKFTTIRRHVGEYRYPKNMHEPTPSLFGSGVVGRSWPGHGARASTNGAFDMAWSLVAFIPLLLYFSFFLFLLKPWKFDNPFLQCVIESPWKKAANASELGLTC